MISVDDALGRIFDLLQPLPSEPVSLRQAAGRILHAPLTARLSQPPFDASAMDGYAIARDDARAGDSFRIVGESAAGHGFAGTILGDEAVRIFTGAPVPAGARRVVIQEDVVRDGDTMVLSSDLDDGFHIRRTGQDFVAGQPFDTDHPLRPVDLALLAAMGHDTVPVTRKPVVAIIATGDELVAPGTQPGPDQIVASNHLGLAAMVEQAGGIARLLPIARDTIASLSGVLDLARGADLIVTIGGASVGDHDLVAQTAVSHGLDRSFYKVAMRPGKPLMAGKLGNTAMIGLPGNPVSSMVCGEIFIRPALDALLGLPARPRRTLDAPLAHDVPVNGPRAHYMRATLTDAGLHIAARQDSSLLNVLASSNALAIRPPHDPARHTGQTLGYIPL